MSLFNTSEDESTESATAPQPEIPAWFWDENVPGSGEKPSFLSEKYKSVAEMAKAQKELESRLGQAPKDYDYSKAQKWFEPEYAPFVEMAEFAKAKHVPQEVMDKFLGSVTAYMEEFKYDVNEEKTKLGPNASERLNILNNWARSNLSEKSYQSLSAHMVTSDAIEALEEVRTKMIGNSTTVPSGNQSASANGASLEEYRSELNNNYDKYKQDPHYRKQMQAKLESIMRE